MESKRVKYNLLLSSIFVLIFSICLFSASKIKADSSENVTGFSWSENIGWISSNNISGGGLTDYGVNVAEDGIMSGYAWSENIGWITFNEADLAGCPQTPCRAWVDTNCLAGQCWLNGWAKVLANGGGWDGWIKLRGNAQDGSPYGVYILSSNGEFHGWAWSDMVVGWISFNCLDRGVCGSSDYKWVTTQVFENSPTAAMSCDSSQCSGGACNGIWIAYRPVADPQPCIYRIDNDSTDPDGPEDIVKSEWYIKPQGQPDTAYQLKLNCANICNYTIQSDVAAGDYTIKLYVEDSTGESDFTTHDLTVRTEIQAGFMCSLDEITWHSCSSLSEKVSQDEIVYLKDDPSLAQHSVASEGATIANREWMLNGVVFGGNNDSVSTTFTQKSNTIRLTVTDGNGRSDYQEFDITAKKLPEWEEVNPVGTLINKMLAGIYRFIGSF